MQRKVPRSQIRQRISPQTKSRGPRRPRRSAAAASLALALTMALTLLQPASPPAMAQDSAAEAIALVERYIKTHNEHRADETLVFYAPDADFHLSMDRGVVSGVDAIARLESFDAAAGSILYPQNLRARSVDGKWVVGFDHVIEYSEVFSAMGQRIVLAQGLQRGFVLDKGRIEVLYQPDLYPACTAIMAGGFRGLVQWLVDSQDTRSDALLRDGRLNLTAGTAPLLIAAAGDWRAQSGWGPTDDEALACAGTRR